MSTRLTPHRDRIDAIDDQIIHLLIERFGIVAEVGQLKAQAGIPTRLPDRIEAVKDRVAARAQAGGLDPDLVRGLYHVIIEHAIGLEDRIGAAGAPGPAPR